MNILSLTENKKIRYKKIKIISYFSIFCTRIYELVIIQNINMYKYLLKQKYYNIISLRVNLLHLTLYNMNIITVVELSIRINFNGEPTDQFNGRRASHILHLYNIIYATITRRYIIIIVLRTVWCRIVSAD